MLECVVNVSEGRRPPVLSQLVAAAADALLDVHVDPHHHRTVLTLAGEEAVRAVAAEAVAAIDLRRHAGVHPRLGAVDVVPFVPLAGSSLGDAVAARDRYATWSAGALGVPCLTYGDGAPTLPEVRRAGRAAVGRRASPTAGATAVGARDVLVAYNLWLGEGVALAEARRAAAAVRGPGVRSLGLRVGSGVQVSLNLVDPSVVGPSAAFDAVHALVPVARAELVGLLPEAVLGAVPRSRWAELDLAPERTIEARLEAAR